MIKPIKQVLVFYENCDGNCSLVGGCTGNIYAVNVGRPDSKYFDSYHYCATAIAADLKNGFIVKRQRKKSNAFLNT